MNCPRERSRSGASPARCLTDWFKSGLAWREHDSKSGAVEADDDPPLRLLEPISWEQVGYQAARI